MGFPMHRPRRLRQNNNFRELVRENSLAAKDFIQPLFAVPGSGIRREISALPENYHLSIDCLVEEARLVRDLGIPAVLLFGVPETKDECGTGAYSPDGIVQQAVRALKSMAEFSASPPNADAAAKPIRLMTNMRLRPR